jgi:manganese transport protein
MDLARMCREEFKPWLNWTLYIICELAIIATDLAEVIGSAIALDLLFGVPLAAGVVIMGLDVLILLLAYRQNGTLKSVRIFEWLIILMVTTVGICFSVELVYVGAPVADVLRGYIPEAALFTEPERIYLAMGIVGATVMPHNLYLHSSIVQARAFLPTQEEAPNYDTSLEGRANAITTTSTTERRRRPGYDTFNSIRTVIRFTVLDCLFALSLALFINSAILVVGAGGFHNHVPDDGTDGDPADLYDAYYLIGRYLGTAAAVIYAVALFIAGQSSTLTATLTGQIVMEGFVGMAIRPWLRRIVTRSCAIVPALIVAIIGGRSGITNLLVVSQVALSVQLPFAMIPLIWFTSSKRIMRPVALNKENGKVAIPALSPATTSINVIESGIGQHHHHHCIDVGCTSRNEMDPEATIICRLIHSSDSRTQPLENENDQHHSRKNIHMEPPASPHNIRKETALMSITTKVYGSIAKSTTNKPSSVDDIDDGVHFANSLPIIVIGGAIVVLLIGLNIYMLIGNSW